MSSTFQISASHSSITISMEWDHLVMAGLSFDLTKTEAHAFHCYNHYLIDLFCVPHSDISGNNGPHIPGGPIRFQLGWKIPIT